MANPRAPGRRRAPPTGAPMSGDALWDALRDGHRRLRAELREILRARGLHLLEYRALSRLQDRELSTGILADELGLAPASMTDLARQLVARGWVVRRRSPVDGRVYRLSATPEGRRVQRSSRSAYRRRLAVVARTMEPEARAALALGLGELIRVLREDPARAGSGDA